MRRPPRRLSCRVLAIASAAAVVTAAAADEPPPGAASCSGCHAARAGVDTAVPRLAGRAAADIVAALQGFRTGQKPATVMDRLAKGFGDDEIRAIADWYARQN